MQRQLQRQLLLRLGEVWGDKTIYHNSFIALNPQHTITVKALGVDPASYFLSVQSKLSCNHVSGCYDAISIRLFFERCLTPEAIKLVFYTQTTNCIGKLALQAIRHVTNAYRCTMIGIKITQ